LPHLRGQVLGVLTPQPLVALHAPRKPRLVVVAGRAGGSCRRILAALALGRGSRRRCSSCCCGCRRRAARLLGRQLGQARVQLRLWGLQLQQRMQQGDAASANA
jgi:hypothetical protein